MFQLLGGPKDAQIEKDPSNVVNFPLSSPCSEQGLLDVPTV